MICSKIFDKKCTFCQIKNDTFDRKILWSLHIILKSGPCPTWNRGKMLISQMLAVKPVSE